MTEHRRPLCYGVEYVGRFGEEFVDPRADVVGIWTERLFLTIRRYR